MNLKDITLHDLFRYGYGGLLLAIVATLVEPDIMKEITSTLGNVGSPLAAFAVGAAVYILYRGTLGEVLFFVLALLNGYWWTECSRCKYRYLNDQLKLKERPPVQSPFFARRAFRLIRDLGIAYSNESREQFYREHSEIHLPYLTGFVLALGAVRYRMLNSDWP